MTLDQLEGIRAARAEESAIRARLDGNLTAAERELEIASLVGTVQKRVELEEAAQVRPLAPNAEIEKLPPEEAARRAAAIRARPEYWAPSTTFDKDGRPVITGEAHQALVSEHVELVQRAAQKPDGAGTNN